jgi:hypothetical protein
MDILPWGNLPTPYRNIWGNSNRGMWMEWKNMERERWVERIWMGIWRGMDGALWREVELIWMEV